MATQPTEGLTIEVTAQGEGEREAKVGDNIHVHYTGYLTSGKKFDSSYDRNDTFKFKLGQGAVIKGWDQGLLGMKVKEQRTLTVHPELAYGSRGFPPVIPPNSVLIFKTKLEKID